jgi:hypothetical protein
LPLFLSIRAAVRAKTSATAVAVQTRAEPAVQLGNEARQHLALAQTLLAPRPAQLVAVGGPSGSGKTTTARRLAPSIGPAPGGIILRSDVARKRAMGVSSLTRLGPDGYTEAVTRQVYRTLAERATRILEDGHGVVVDAVCGESWQHAILADAARASGVPFVGLWLDAPLPVLTDRLQRRADDASDATPQVAARQVERAGGAPPSWTRIDASGGADGVVVAARAALGITASE